MLLMTSVCGYFLYYFSNSIAQLLFLYINDVGFNFLSHDLRSALADSSSITAGIN